ncbi:MAG: diacylglycerol kinase family lipid kinase [Acetobacteraceae bacterium]|nr:diacylglycerol kinase family lipid kinase [Acetobacteraceae bacterium]
MMVVFNPIAGRRRAPLLWRVLDTMIANGMRLELAETTSRGHAEKLARSAAVAGERLVVAAGGDGTIAEVANGLMGFNAKLGVIPLGTANVLAHELALPFAPRAIAAALAFGRTRALWPGLATGPATARLFVQMLGLGFDAEVVRRLSPQLKLLFGRAAYVWQTLRELPRYPFQSIRLRIDGDETEVASAIVTKGRLYGGQYLLAPDARPGEPGLSVVLFKQGGPFAALRCGAALPLNRLPGMPGIQQRRAMRVEILGEHRVPAQVDGDPAGFSPLTVTDAAAPIQVVAG